MNYNDIWNDICYRIKNKNQNAPEREFQIIAEFIFDKLGWSMRKGEIVTGKTIPAGSADNKKPDIIIADNGKYLFVVELKKPAAALTERNAMQIFSYMRLLKLNFGILLGESVQIFYESPGAGNDPQKIGEIAFDTDSDAGIEFIKLLSRDEYSPEKIESYCLEKIEAQGEKEKAQNYINALCQAEGAGLIADMLKEKLQREFSGKIVSYILGEITISVLKKAGMPTNGAGRIDEGRGQVTRARKGGKDHTQYRLNGQIVGGKNALVRAVLRLYAKRNPNITLKQLRMVFPDDLGGTQFGVVNTLENAVKINKTEPSPRYHTSEPIPLAGNEQAAVCTQWHPVNISRFIEKARQLGFDIAEIKEKTSNV